LEEAITREAKIWLRRRFGRLIDGSVKTIVYTNTGGGGGDGGERARREGPVDTHDIVIEAKLDLDEGEEAELRRNTATNAAYWQTAVSQAITAAASTLKNEGLVDGYVAPASDQIYVEFGTLGGRISPSTLATQETPSEVAATTTLAPNFQEGTSAGSRADKQLTIMVPVLCSVALIAAMLLYVGYRGASRKSVSMVGAYSTNEGDGMSGMSGIGGGGGGGHFGGRGEQYGDGGPDQNSTFLNNSFEREYDDGNWGTAGMQLESAARGGAETSYLSAKAGKSVYLGEDEGEQTSWV